MLRPSLSCYCPGALHQHLPSLRAPLGPKPGCSSHYGVPQGSSSPCAAPKSAQAGPQGKGKVSLADRAHSRSHSPLPTLQAPSVGLGTREKALGPVPQSPGYGRGGFSPSPGLWDSPHRIRGDTHGVQGLFSWSQPPAVEAGDAPSSVPQGQEALGSGVPRAPPPPQPRNPDVGTALEGSACSQPQPRPICHRLTAKSSAVTQAASAEQSPGKASVRRKY